MLKRRQPRLVLTSDDKLALWIRAEYMLFKQLLQELFSGFDKYTDRDLLCVPRRGPGHQAKNREAVGISFVDEDWEVTFAVSIGFTKVTDDPHDCDHDRPQLYRQFIAEEDKVEASACSVAMLVVAELYNVYKVAYNMNDVSAAAI